MPERSATAVERLQAAGAVLVGKTNLDQFATGLVGTRSPYGEVPNTFDPAHVCGGSSAGSASVVARGLVAFSLGTDTAGSGRVPAGFNNLVGLKPTPGRVAMAGVVPACRTLDVVSVFALTVADAAEVMTLIDGNAGEPRFAGAPLAPSWFGNGDRLPRIGVPMRPDCVSAVGYDRAFEAAMQRLRGAGIEPVPIDFEPFFEVARLLYEGPWVAERFSVVRDLLDADPAAFDPVVRAVIAGAARFDAAAAFEARYRLEALRLVTDAVWQSVDVLMVPTSPDFPTRAQVADDPIGRNSVLGRFTNFVNLLGQAALAVPAGFTGSGLPFGVTFIAPGGADAALARLGAWWQGLEPVVLGAHLRPLLPEDLALRALPRSSETIEIAVVGAHLRGMPLHGQLLERNCRFNGRTTTAAAYRLYALAGGDPRRPGLVRDALGGAAIEVETYEMPLQVLGSFLAGIAPPLGLGSIELADGRWVKGFICEPIGLAGATDITAHGGWRSYLETA
jgi:allophanate hydrolase